MVPLALPVPGLVLEPLIAAGATVVTSAAGVVKLTVTSLVFCCPVASVTVTRNDSLRFSPQPTLALKLPVCVPVTLMRLPLSRVQA